MFGASVRFPPKAEIGVCQAGRYSTPVLVPYWIECANAPGVGVTARSEEDALSLLRDAFGGEREPSSVKPIHDASELDQGHVVPNMGNWLRRGIWYPLGHEHVAKF